MKAVETPYGVSDILPDEAWRLRKLEQQLLELFCSWSYREVRTSAVEYFQTLSGTAEETQLFKLIEREGRILALRPEMTIPIARMVAGHWREEDLPLRLCYSANVFRFETPREGRKREFHQAGVELLGVANSRADSEVISLAIEAAKSAGVEDFRLGLGQVELTRGVLREADLPWEIEQQVKGAISQKDLVKLENLLDTMTLSKGRRELINTLSSLHGGREVLDRARGLLGERRALAELEEVIGFLEAQGLAEHIFIDFSILRDFDYYTGIVFEGYTSKLGYPLCGGGRYDRLLEQFGLKAPATGFALGLERLMLAAAGERAKHVDVLLVGSDFSRMLMEASRLRRGGMVVELDLLGQEAGEAREYALRHGIEQVLEVGDDGE